MLLGIKRIIRTEIMFEPPDAAAAAAADAAAAAAGGTMVPGADSANLPTGRHGPPV